MDKREMAKRMRRRIPGLLRAKQTDFDMAAEEMEAGAAALEREAEAEEKARPKATVGEMVETLRAVGEHEARPVGDCATRVLAAADLIERVAKLPERWKIQTGAECLACRSMLEHALRG